MAEENKLEANNNSEKYQKFVALEDKIMEGLRQTSLQLIETKRKNKQQMVVFMEGKIQIIDP